MASRPMVLVAMSGIDRGDHEWEYDPVSDKINDILDDYVHSEDFQDWLWQTLMDLRDHIQTIDAQVHQISGDTSWRYPVDGDLNGLRCAIETYYDKPHKGETNRKTRKGRPMSKPKPSFRFDPTAHAYFINNRPVPSVTQVMADVIPGWRAADWYLQRGIAVHACAAMIAQGLEFEHDERIAGQVGACRRFFADTCQHVKTDAEVPVYSVIYQYAGTLDLVVKLHERWTIIDYKATLTDAVPIQMAAYALAHEEMGYGKVSHGLGVQLNDDGSYKCTEPYQLSRYKAEWLALLTAYNIRRRLKIKEEETCPQN